MKMKITLRVGFCNIWWWKVQAKPRSLTAHFDSDLRMLLSNSDRWVAVFWMVF